MITGNEKGSRKNDTFIIEDGEHLEINGKSGGKDTISFAEDLRDLSISKDGLNLKIEGTGKSATILNYFSKDGKTTSSSVKYLQVGSTPENTKVIDLLQSGIINSGIEEFARDRKGKITGSAFSDTISGTDMADKIYGYGGNDEITGGLENDTITGGAGKNAINYTFDAEKSHGNDVINLTKGENLVLDIAGADLEDLRFEYSSNKKDLIIYKEKVDGEYVESITLKNFASKDVTNNSNAKKGIEDTSSVELKINGETYDLRNAIYDVDGDSEKDYFYQIKTEKNYTGSWLNEEIDATSAPAGKNNKGVTIKGLGGDDKITGSLYNDTITGGAGENTILYSKGSGNDVINLTKGENFTLKLTDIDSINELKFDFVKNDLRIYTDLGKYNDEDKTNDEYITIKNFVAKDVTNNGNAKKGIEDESSVMLEINGETYDLRNAIYDINGDSEKEYLYQRDTEKNYTGSWLNEDISAKGYDRYTDKKKKIVDEDVTKKGLTLNGKDGDDLITGSNYSDTIKGGNGDDTIKGGTGNDKLYGEAGKNTFVFSNSEKDSHDTIYSGKGEDTINFAYSKEEVDNFSLADLKFEQVMKKGVGTKDLEISYGDNNTIIVKDYYAIDKKGNITGINAKTSLKNITVHEGTFNLEEILFGENNLILGTKDNDTDINGTENNDLIITGAGNDIVQTSEGDDEVYLGAGNDEIFSYAGNNKIYAGSGVDTIYGDTNSGNDTVYGQDGDDYIYYETTLSEVFLDGGEGRDTIRINYGTAIGGLGEDEIRVPAFTGNATIYGDLTLDDDAEQVKGDTDRIYGSDEANIIYGGGGDDIINGSGGADIIYGGAGGDNIETGTKDGGIEETDVTEVYGNEGSDTITLQGYKNIVSGGVGNDSITGYNTGEDIFVYQKGDGTDYIEGGDVAGKTDAIKFTDDTTLSDLKVSLDGDNLIIQYSNSADDKIIITNYLKEGAFNSPIDKIIFADGTEKAIKTDLNLTIYIDGETTYTDNVLSNIIVGSDTTGCTIYGGLGNDTIVSGKANDIIYGGEGANTYVFNANGGTDVVYSSSGFDTIKIDGVPLGSMTATVNGNDVEITNSVYPEDKVIVKDYLNTLVDITIKDNSGFTTSLLEKLEDAGIIVGDGEIDGTDEVNRILGGDNDDIINGKQGNDILNGGKGSDTYIFADFDGADIVSNGTDGKADTLKFTSSTKEELTYAISDNDLVISHNDGADSVTVKDYFAAGNTVTDLIDSTGETFKIADVNKYVLAESDTVTGTRLNDVITLTTGNHTVNGGSGNDIITTGEGADIIEGDVGYDVINMGTGGVTFVFRNGDGHDTIYMNEFDTTEDKLQFADSEYYDIKYELNGDDMILWHDKDVNGNYNSSVTIKDWTKYYDPETDKTPVLNSIYNANGYTYSQQNILYQFRNEIENYSEPKETVTGTKFKDIIHTDDITETIYAGFGDDTINGRTGDSGEDKVYGEAGDDSIFYENSSNEVLLDGGTGHDVIRINYGTAIGGLGGDQIRVSSYSSGVTIYGDLTLTKDAEQTQGDYDLITGSYGGYEGQEQTGGDTIYAGGGDDTVYGYGGSDVIYGGAGADTIYGYGREENKNLNAGVVLEIHGGIGDDVIYAQSETNKIYGDAGNDTVYAYIDQNTTISDTEGDNKLVIENTKNTTDNLYTNLHIVFNVDKEGNLDADGIRVLNNENYQTWVSDNDSENIVGVKIVEGIDKFGSISTTNAGGTGYEVTDITALVEAVSGWLTSDERDYQDVASALASENKDALLEFIATTTTWSEI